MGWTVCFLWRVEKWEWMQKNPQQLGNYTIFFYAIDDLFL